MLGLFVQTLNKQSFGGLAALFGHSAKERGIIELELELELNYPPLPALMMILKLVLLDVVAAVALAADSAVCVNFRSAGS